MQQVNQAAAATASSAGSTSPEQDALKALTFQRLHPKTYLERFLAENVRPDGRDFDEWRDVSVNVGMSSVRMQLHPSMGERGRREQERWMEC